ELVAVAVGRHGEARARVLRSARGRAAAPRALGVRHIPVTRRVDAGEMVVIVAGAGVEPRVGALVGAVTATGRGLVLGPTPHEGGEARVLGRELVEADDVDAAGHHAGRRLRRDQVVPAVEHVGDPGAVLEVPAEARVVLPGRLVGLAGGVVVGRGVAVLVPA